MQLVTAGAALMPPADMDISNLGVLPAAATPPALARLGGDLIASQLLLFVAPSHSLEPTQRHFSEFYRILPIFADFPSKSAKKAKMFTW